MSRINLPPAPLIYSQSGTLSPGSGQTQIIMPRAGTISSVQAAVGTSPTGQSILIDVDKNGASVFTTQANRPSITANANVGSAALPDITAFAIGDIFTVDIDQVGSNVAGSDLSVTINVVWT